MPALNQSTVADPRVAKGAATLPFGMSDRLAIRMQQESGRRAWTIIGMSTAKLGHFDDLIQLANAPLRPIMERLRSIILEIDPEVCQVVRLGDRAATYGCGPRKMIEGYSYIMPFANWVNLGFFRGASLADPQNLLAGSGKKMRHVKIRSLEDAERPGVRQLIVDACAERRSALNR